MTEQLSFLNPIYPPGFRLMPNFINSDGEQVLLDLARSLAWENYEQMGVVAKRKIFRYEITSLPELIQSLLPRVSRELRVEVVEIAHVLFTHYPIGAPIGWHRDAPLYQKLLGISLENYCVMKLRPYDQSVSPTLSVPLPARSAYVIQGNARWEWEHHIPPVKQERFSLTFRTQNMIKEKRP